MTEMLHELIAFVLKNDAGLTESRARTVASYFGDIEGFLGATPGQLRKIRGIGRRRPIVLTEDEIARIMDAKTYLDPNSSVSENFLAAIGRDFVKRQVRMIRSMTLDDLNPNPFLIRTLNLSTPAEVVGINVYMAVTRSIVTSMGFFVEKLLLVSSDSVERAPRGSGWDLIKIGDKGEKYWIQVKSGPNDMDKDQIIYWSRKIEEKVLEGDRAFIGITYGKRLNETVSIGLMKQLLPDWEIKTLIGRELWDFVSGDPHYSSRLLDILRSAACSMLKQSSICQEIEKCIQRIEKEFVHRFGDGEQGVAKYLSTIF